MNLIVLIFCTYHDFIVYPFKDNRYDFTCNFTSPSFYNIYFLTFFKSFIYTFKLLTMPFYKVILNEMTFYNIRFTNEVGNKSIFWFIINMCYGFYSLTLLFQLKYFRAPASAQTALLSPQLPPLSHPVSSCLYDHQSEHFSPLKGRVFFQVDLPLFSVV